MSAVTNNLSDVNAKALETLKAIAGGIELLGTGEESTPALIEGYKALEKFAKNAQLDLEQAAFAAANPGFVLTSDGYHEVSPYGERRRVDIIDGIYLDGRYCTHVARRAVNRARNQYSYRVDGHESLGTFKTPEAAFEAYVAARQNS